FLRCDIRDLNDAILAGRGKHLAVWTKGQRRDSFFVLVELRDQLLTLDVPHADAAIVMAGGHPAAVGPKRHRGDPRKLLNRGVLGPGRGLPKDQVIAGGREPGRPRAKRPERLQVADLKALQLSSVRRPGAQPAGFFYGPENPVRGE